MGRISYIPRKQKSKIIVQFHIMNLLLAAIVIGLIMAMAILASIYTSRDTAPDTGFIFYLLPLFIVISLTLAIITLVRNALIKKQMLARNISNMRDSLNAQAGKIQEANEHAQSLYNTMPICCCLWDSNCKIFDCNDEAVRTFSLKSKEEFIDRFFELSPKFQSDGSNSTEQILTLIRRAFDEGFSIFEWEHQLLDGSPVLTEVILVRVKVGEEFIVASYTRDLRILKLMVNEIMQQDALLKAVNRVANILLQSEPDDFVENLINCMGMMAEVTNVDRVCIWKNIIKNDKRIAQSIYEWPLGINTVNSSTLDSEIPYSDFPVWEETLESKKSANIVISEQSGETEKFLEEHGILTLLLVPVFLRDQFWGFLSFEERHKERVFTDVEESILSSGSLLIANALWRNEMIQNLRATSIQLETALENAGNANRAKSDFLANMSHEMRTPLNAVIGLTGLTLETQGLNAETRDNLEKIYNAGSTLLSTVNDILDISKIEAGKFELITVEYDLSSLINDTITQSSIYIGEKPIKFELDINEDLPAKLYGDELRVKQILNNLLSNACKYTREGNIELKIRCEREGGIVWFIASVKDSGIGIKQEDIQNLFRDYVRMDLVNSKNEGTGLGLSIAKKEVEMMGGSISVESEFGKGSKFTIKIRQRFVDDSVIGPDVVANLKSFRYSASKRDWNFRQARIDLSYARILLVDDNITNLDVAKGILNLYGIKTDCVSCGKDAIEAIRSETVKYNAVFMDHMMPEIDGVEATRIIRDEIGTQYAKTVPIFALTANAIVGNEEMFLDKGFQAFISKPIEMDRLDVILRQYVRDKDLEKALAGRRINIGGQMREDMRRRKERRTISERRSGLDRRTFGKDIAGLDMEKGMARFGNHRETYINVLRSFAVNTRPLLDNIREIRRENLSDYAIEVHGIKGSSRGIYASIVGDKAEALEKAAKTGNLDFVIANNSSFLEDIAELINNIEEMLKETDIMENKQEKDKLDLDTLIRLLDACSDYNIDEIDASMDEMEQYVYSDDDDLYRWLRENIDQMNYKAVIEKLSVLCDKRRFEQNE